MNGPENSSKHPSLPPSCVGMLNTLEFAWAFMTWADAAGSRLNWRMVVERWGVSRATAFRYLSAWRAFKDARAAAESRRAA